MLASEIAGLVRVVDGLEQGRQDKDRPFFCHSLGSDKCWNKEVFKVER